MTEEKYNYGEYNIIYMFSKCTYSQKLIVVFSGYTTLQAEDRHPYNFQNILSEFPANVLYIRDNIGNRGVYYLCYHGDFSVSDAVCALIRDICKENHIKMCDVITLGSSKGASAALHIGLKLECGNILASVPQIKIASFISASCKDTFLDMIPEDDDGTIFNKINEYIPNLIRTQSSSVVFLHTSENDIQFADHIAPIIPILKKKNYNKVIINNRINDHGDVVNYNPNFAIYSLLSIVFGCQVLQEENKINIILNDSSYDFVIKVVKSDWSEYTYNITQNTAYKLEDILLLELMVGYRDQFSFSWNIYNWLKSLQNMEIDFIKGYATLIIQSNKELMVPVNYALYQVFQGNLQINYPYQKSNHFKLDLNGDEIPTEFRVFCKDKIQRSSIKVGIGAIKFKNDLQRKLFNTKYHFVIENDFLKFKLCVEDYDDTYLYCFYILRNNKIVFKGDYSPKPEKLLLLQKSGFYSVMYYIYNNGQREYLYSKSLEYKKRYSVSIYGSCVTRDLFEYDKSENLELKQYIARQSIISAVSAPIDLEENQIKLNSNFQKRMVLMDLKKNCFENLKENRSDYLIIDLIDERFPLLFYKNSYCTASNEALHGIEQLKDLPVKQKIIYKGLLSIKDESLDCNSIIREFCERIMRIYKPDEIILHRALFVDKYINKSGDIVSFSKNYLIDNKTKNQVLEYMYDLLVNFIPGIHIINEMPQTVASENHKWGLSPMHYYDDYYLRVLKRLNEIISNRENL